MKEEQRSEEWFAVRLGKFTGSQIYRLMTEPRKKGEVLSEGAKTYVQEKAVEIITGQAIQSPDTAATRWGVEHEPEAKSLLEQLFGQKIVDPGFLDKGTWGASPDGIMGEHIIEIKSPFVSTNHLTNLLMTDLKGAHKDYYYQVQLEMLAAGLDKAYFVSYDPRFPEDRCLGIYEVQLVEEDAEKMLARIEEAEKYKQKLLSDLKTI